jgi:hypothetical protein
VKYREPDFAVREQQRRQARGRLVAPPDPTPFARLATTTKVMAEYEKALVRRLEKARWAWESYLQEAVRGWLEESEQRSGKRRYYGHHISWSVHVPDV